MFGIKKRTVEEVLSAIEKLTDEERAQILSALSGKQEEAPQTEEAPKPETEEPTAEIPEEPTASEGEAEDPAEEPAQEPAEPPAEVPQEEFAEEGGGEAEETPESLPEAPQEGVEAEDPTDNSKELFDAQNARIDALESQIAAMQKTLENIVSAADNKDFGASPEADFSGEEQSSRYSAVLQGYAGRRARDYQ